MTTVTKRKNYSGFLVCERMRTSRGGGQREQGRLQTHRQGLGTFIKQRFLFRRFLNVLLNYDGSIVSSVTIQIH